MKVEIGKDPIKEQNGGFGETPFEMMDSDYN